VDFGSRPHYQFSRSFGEILFIDARSWAAMITAHQILTDEDIAKIAHLHAWQGEGGG
jgi:hypothetical protein